MNGWQLAFRFIGIGWFIAISIVAGFLIGVWLDKRFDTRPLWTLVGGTFGLIVALFGMYRLFKPIYLMMQKDVPTNPDERRE